MESQDTRPESETITAKEIGEITEIPKRTTLHWAKQYGWKYIKMKIRGGYEKRFIIESIKPDGIKSTIMAARMEERLPAILPEEFSNLPAVSGEIDPLLGEWYGKPESCREEAVKLLGLVNKARSLKARTKKGKTKALIRYARSQDIAWQSLYRHMKKADDAMTEALSEGTDVVLAQVMALTHEFGKNRGVHTVFSNEAISYARNVFASQKHLNVSDVYNRTVSEAKIQGWNFGSYDTLNRILREMDNPLVVRSRKGKRKYEADCQLKILRDYREIWPNFMWCGDHHIFDVFIKAPGGKILRPWVTAWMDMASRSLMGWCISLQPNSRTIALALSHAISMKDDENFPQHGLPWSVYIDNGKDYRSKYLNGEEINFGQIDYPEIMERFSAMGIDPYYIDLKYDPKQQAWVKKRGTINHTVKSVRMGGVYARLNIHQRYATAYHPWGKPIERMFRNVVQQFSRNQPGWCGSGHEQRPEKLTFEIRHGLLLDYEEFCERFYQWAVYQYNKSPHTGHGMEGRSPDEVFCQYGQPQAVDTELVSFALLKKEQVKIYNWGFNLNGSELELDVPATLTGAAILNRIINRYATILYDPDYKMVRVYLDGEFICRARRLRRASFIRADDQVMQDKLKLQAYQDRLVKQSLQNIREESPLELGYSETEALLALTAGQSGSDEHEFDSNITAVAPMETEEPIPLVEEERYWMIMRKEVEGKQISEKDQAWKDEYEQTEEYRDRAQLYHVEFEYMKYQYQKEANV